MNQIFAYQRHIARLLLTAWLLLCLHDFALAESLWLEPDEGIELNVPVGANFIIVTNQGIDSVGQLLTTDGQVISQSATWRGSDGTYVLDVQHQDTDSIVIKSFEPSVAAGNIDIRWVFLSDLGSDKQSLGLSRVSAAANFRLSYAQTGLDTRLQAMDYYEESLALLEHTEHSYLLPNIYYEIGSIFLSLSQLEDARNYLQNSLALYKEQSNRAGEAASFKLLGLVSHRMASRGKALEFYQQALVRYIELGDSINTGLVYNNIGLTEWVNDNYQEAREPYYQALILLSGAEAKSIQEVIGLDAEAIQKGGYLTLFINTLNNLALVEKSLGNVAQAENLWRSSLRLNTQTSQKEFVFRSEFNLGRMLTEQGRFDEALEHLDSAAGYFQAYNDSSWYGQSLEWLGNLYASITDYEQAYINYEQALALSGQDRQQRANVLRRLAGINWEQNNRVLAGEQYEEALQFYEALNLRSSVANVQSEYSQLQHQNGAFEEAYKNQINAMISLRQLGDRRGSAQAQSRLGQMYANDGEIKLAEENLLAALDEHRVVNDELFELDTLVALANIQEGEQAVTTLSDATKLASSIQLNTLAPALQSNFLESRRMVFESHIDSLLKVGNVEAAWKVSEQIRARSLLDLIQSAESSEQPDDQDRDELISELQATPDPEQRLAVQRKLDILHGRERRIANVISGDNYDNTVEQLQGQLTADVVVLSYFLGEKHSHLWSITKDKIQHFELPEASEINALASELSSVLRSQRHSPSQVLYLSSQLSEMILPVDIETTQFSNMVVLADSNLHLVPFGLLPLASNSSDQSTDQTNRVLLDQMQVTYSPSARLYRQLSVESHLDHGQLLVLADPLANVNQKQPRRSNLLAQRALQQTAINLDQLPGAQIEARSIAMQVELTADASTTAENPRAWSLDTRIGGEASQAFMASAELIDYDIIHFATHGVVDAEFPDLSGLVLAPEVTAQESMTYLRPHQIAGLELGAELVVLSSCETGIGKSLTGEGPMSLSRPFFIAGAKQVVSSLWKISDQATAELMEQFYHNLLLEQMPASMALREAQLWMRNHDQWWHPYFWAGFTLQGGNVTNTQENLLVAGS